MSEETQVQEQPAGEESGAIEDMDITALARDAMGLGAPEPDELDELDDEPDGGGAGEPEGDEGDEPSESQASSEEDQPDKAPTPEPSKPKVVDTQDDPMQRKLDAMMARAQNRIGEAERQATSARLEAERVSEENKQLREQARILETFKADPMTGLDAIARAAGVDPEKALQEILERRTEGHSALSLERIRAEAQQAAEARVKSWEEQQRAAQQADREHDVRSILAMQQSADDLKKYPHLLSFDPATLEQKIRTAYQNAEAKPHLRPFLKSRDALLTELDKYEESLYLQRQQRMGAPVPASATGAPGAPPEPSEAPPGQVTDAETSRRQSRTITNDDTANSSGATRPKSERQTRAELRRLALENL